MKKYFCLFFLFCSSVGVARSGDLTRWVDPFIGTGAVASSLSGNNYPGAGMPFGMVQLSPDTREVPDWGQASGYDYNDSIVYGFSHTHLSGTGVADLIDILTFPTVDGARSSRFSHSQESARPGYYEVMLQDEGIRAELTATTHVGVHRYTYPHGGNAAMWLDLEHSAKKNDWGRRIIQSQMKWVSPCVVEGYRVITGWAKLRKVYFHLEFSRPVRSCELEDGDRKYTDMKVINGSSLHGLFHFDVPEDGTLVVKVALSAVSVENARMNLEAEAPGWDFDRMVADADVRWEKELDKIRIEGTDREKRVFYTALYHTMLQPNEMSDVNGDYMGTDYVVRRLPAGEHDYSTFSLWDTFRGAHPLYVLMHPGKNRDFVNSMIRQYGTYGYLPVWQLWGQENYCMIGNHAIPVVVDAVMKGIPDIDTEKAYEAVRNSALVSHPNFPVDVWEKYGYMPENLQTQSVFLTLEEAYDDWYVAQLAKKTGHRADYERFMKRSAFYRNLYNPASGFFQPKDDKGKWMEPFDPYKYGANGGYPFTEGNAWQYFWYVPQNIPDLIALTGGKRAFVNKLDSFFTVRDKSGPVNSNASGFIGQYAHGNEPSHHVAYLYACAGEPWKTQKYVAYIMKNLYTEDSSGYAGNEDCGEMSAWYVFSALGFYPVNPVGGEYVIGTPMLHSATLRLPGGKVFRIKVYRKKESDIYIRSMKLNGKPHSVYTLSYADLSNGGLMEFYMMGKPRK